MTVNNKCCWLYAKDKINVYSACFIGKSLAELVADFNKEVGAGEVSQDKVYYHEALLHAFEEKGVDVSEVSDGLTGPFERRVCFDEVNRKLVKE